MSWRSWGFSAAIWVFWVAAPQIAPAADDGAHVRGGLAIVTQFEARSEREVIDSMRREVAAVLSLPASALIWLESAEPAEADASDRVLLVAHFRGPCAAATTSDEIREGDHLGHAYTFEGIILPLIEVNCDKVWTHIQPWGQAASYPRRQFLLGRALARVLCHEMYHVLAGTIHHESTGVAKAVFTPEDLLAPRLRFERKQLERMYRGGLLPGNHTGRHRAGVHWLYVPIEGILRAFAHE